MIVTAEYDGFEDDDYTENYIFGVKAEETEKWVAEEKICIDPPAQYGIRVDDERNSISY